MLDCVSYVPNFVGEATRLKATGCFAALWHELDWGRRGLIPRREYYCTELEVGRAHGVGLLVRGTEPQPWNSTLRAIKRQVEQAVGTQFDEVLVSGHEFIADALDWHSDLSPTLDATRPIAIVSLGEPRDILFREKGAREVAGQLALEHGSLCVMTPEMHFTHEHCSPRANLAGGRRISITLRGCR